jgi:AbrB family looped-hinge helix DNA binding protein
MSKIYLVYKIYMEVDMELKKGKKFYGSVTVSERGQIAIPVEARHDFDIKTGDKLLVMADLEKGIVLTKSNFVLRMMEETLEASRKLETMINDRRKETGDK